jgi:hypothetical protein
MELVPLSATPQEKDYRLVAPQMLVLPNSEQGDGSALAGVGVLGIRNNPTGGAFNQYSWVTNPDALPPVPAGALQFVVNNSGSITEIDYITTAGVTHHEQQQVFDGAANFNNPVAFLSSVSFAVPPTGIPAGGGLAPVTGYTSDNITAVAPPVGAGQTIVTFGTPFTPAHSGVYMIEYYLGQNISDVQSITWGAPDWIAGRLNYLNAGTPSFTGFSCIFPKSTPVSGSGGADNTDNSVTIVILEAGIAYQPAYVLNNGSGTSTWSAGTVNFECSVTSLCG